MLEEIYIRNIAVIDELHLKLGPGLTVLSGDEGAGKSLVVDALCLLAGGKAATSLVRTGTAAALVEGIFHVAPGRDDVTGALESAGVEVEPDGSLIISREVQEHGKSVARVNGRALPVSLLREIGQGLVDIHGQMEHLSLLRPEHQHQLLDGYAGILPVRAEVAAAVSRLREADRELGLISEEKSDQERGLLEYQVAEIKQAKVQPGEDESLAQERNVLERAQELEEQCRLAHAALYSDERAAATVVHEAVKAVRRAASIDPTLLPQAERLDSLATEIEDTGRELGRYMENVDTSPARLEQVEERLELLRRLKNKYGPTLQDVARFAEQAAGKLHALESRHERRAELEAECQKARTEAGRLAEKLSFAREEAAKRLAGLVNAELAELGMPQAGFDIRLDRQERPDGLPARGAAFDFAENGIDRVLFLARTNPGEPMRALTEIASGGETCRFMLALKTTLQQADSIPTLVFDEIDAGVGGRNAHTIGKKLAALGEGRQVLCVTHLPQIACFGNQHYRVTKDVSSGRAVTRMDLLEGETRVEELAAMLGTAGEAAMIQGARELLRSAGQDAGTRRRSTRK